MVKIVQKCSFPVNFSPPPGGLVRDGRAIGLPSGEIKSLHCHNLCEVGLCRCGEGLWLVGDSVTAIKPGDAMLIPPGVSHYSRALDACRCEFIYFDAESFLRLNGVGMKPRLPVQSVFDGELAKYLKNMIEAPDTVESALWFALFIKKLPESSPAQPTDESLAPALRRIMLSYAEDISVDELAAECGFSKSWFIKRFSCVYRMTPIGFLNDFRTKVAAELLKSDLPVTEVATRAGFSSPSDLYRHFTKKYGVSPSEYRKESKK